MHFTIPYYKSNLQLKKSKLSKSKQNKEINHAPN